MRNPEDLSTLSDCSTEEVEDSFNFTEELLKQCPTRQSRIPRALEDDEVILQKFVLKGGDVRPIQDELFPRSFLVTLRYNYEPAKVKT